MRIMFVSSIFFLLDSLSVNAINALNILSLFDNDFGIIIGRVYIWLYDKRDN